jgi:hypothetical protein
MKRSSKPLLNWSETQTRLKNWLRPHLLLVSSQYF